MGTCAETAIVDYVYLLPIKENKLPFSVSVCSSKESEKFAVSDYPIYDNTDIHRWARLLK
jgi:hypothetical protein